MATTSFPLTLLTLSIILSVLASSGVASNFLLSGSRLRSGESLVYKHRVTGKVYNLTMQADCNLVLYDDDNSVWSTGTAMSFDSFCDLQLRPDSELAIFLVRLPSPLWTSGTSSVVGYYALVLRYDGSLRVYGPAVWYIPPPSPSLAANLGPSLSLPATTESVLYTDDVAPIGTTIANGDYALVLQDSCNLVLTNTRTGEVLCESQTTDPLRDCFVTLNATGQLVIAYMGGETLWVHGGASNYGDYVLVLQDS